MHAYKRLDLLVASFLINILGLAIPIYIIHSINRYLGNDNLDTLIFLTVTVIVATILEHLIRKYRKFIILNINDKKFNSRNFVENNNFQSDNKIEQELNYIKSLPKNYDLNMQISFLDVPYILLFSAVIYLLSPLIFFLYSFLALIVLIISIYHRINQNKYFKNINQLNSEYTHYENKLKQNLVNFRVNLIYKKILNLLNCKQGEIFNQKKLLDSDSYNFETINSFLLNILIIFVVMISLLEINRGDMQISSMIALNILVVRALLPIKLIPNIIFYQYKLNSINHNANNRNNIKKNKLYVKDLIPIKNIKLNNISYFYHNDSIPLFSQFSINFAKGTTTVISGENASGKSTLFNIICGAIEPINGTIQINGIDINRTQKERIYEISSIMSQYPVFKDNTFLECLEYKKDDLGLSKIEDLLNKCNLDTFFSDKKEGVNYNLSVNENLISLGIKKRIALSQFLYKDSEVILFDEPTQGCDHKTCQIFYNFLNEKISEKKMVIIFSNDPLIIQGAQIVLELKKGSKPIYLKK